MIKKQVDIDEAHLAWFTETYGGASLSWFLNLLIEEYIEVHKNTPRDYASIGAKALKEKLEDGTV